MYVTLGLQFSFFQKPIDVLDCKLIKSKLWRNLYVLICLACFRALWKNCGRFSLHPSPFRIFFQVNRNLQMNKTSRLSQWAGNGLEWNKHPAASNFLLYSLYSTQLKWFQNFILFFFFIWRISRAWIRYEIAMIMEDSQSKIMSDSRQKIFDRRSFWIVVEENSGW